MVAISMTDSPHLMSVTHPEALERLKGHCLPAWQLFLGPGGGKRSPRPQEFVGARLQPVRNVRNNRLAMFGEALPEGSSP